MLSLTNVQIMYDRAIEAVRDVSLEIGERQIVALLGSNGAGKSTILKAISNVLYPEEGEVLHGQIRFGARDLLKTPADEIVRSGIVHVPEGRRLFAHMTVEDNLAMGGYLRNRAQVSEGFDKVYALFPRVAERRKSLAGYLSGGEQQMVAIGRALMSKPDLLMLDEPSLGLAPVVVGELFSALGRIRDSGPALLVVEQNVRMSLLIADRGYLMEAGRIAGEDTATALMDDDAVKRAFLGATL